MSENMWMERAQSAEAKLKTLREAQGAAIDRVRDFKANFGIRERDNGDIIIDFQKFTERLGEDSAKALRNIINEKYGREVMTVTEIVDVRFVKPKRKYVRKEKVELEGRMNGK